jgi:hypothetical protein
LKEIPEKRLSEDEREKDLKRRNSKKLGKRIRLRN